MHRLHISLLHLVHYLINQSIPSTLAMTKMFSLIGNKGLPTMPSAHSGWNGFGNGAIGEMWKAKAKVSKKKENREL